MNPGYVHFLQTSEHINSQTEKQRELQKKNEMKQQINFNACVCN